MIADVEKDDLKTPLGVTVREVADICLKSWFTNTCREQAYEAEHAAHLERWEEAAEQMFAVCEHVLAGRGRVSVPWKSMRSMFQRIATGEEVPDEQNEIKSRIYEAAARQAVNLVLAQRRGEFDEARDHDWRGWIVDPTKKETDDDRDDDSEEGDFEDDFDD